MEFKKGFKIKPKNIKRTGEVIFTDGTNDVFANQKICQEYGYNYDTSNGTCYAYRFNTLIDKRAKNLDNKVAGKNNFTSDGTEATFISGQNNSTEGLNKNTFITGQNNTVKENVNNALVTGSFARANNLGEFVIGGGTFLEEADILPDSSGFFQTSFILMNTVTVGTQSNSAMVQRTGDIDFTDTNVDVSNYIQIINNTIQVFEIDVISLQFSGSSGAAGTFDQFKIEGVYKTGADGNRDSLTQSTTYKINNSDLTPPVIADSPVAGGITVQCEGKTNINLNWYVNVKMITCGTITEF
jgi:hypothetical protein